MEKKYEFTIKTAIFYTLILFLLELLVSIIGVFIFSIVFKLINSQATPEDIKSSYLLYPVILIISELIFLGIAMRIKNKYQNNIKNIISFSNIKFIFLLMIIVVSIFYVFPSSELENIFSSLIGRFDSFSETFMKVAQIPNGIGLIVSIVTVAIVPALIEELLFRGLIQKNLANKYGNITAIIITSLLFTIIHVNPTALVSIFILSIILGYVYKKTNNLLYPIILHFINNIIALLVVRYNSFEIKGLNTVAGPIEHISLSIIIPATIITLLLLYIIIKKNIQRHDMPITCAEPDKA